MSRAAWAATHAAVDSLPGATDAGLDQSTAETGPLRHHDGAAAVPSDLLCSLAGQRQGAGLDMIGRPTISDAINAELAEPAKLLLGPPGNRLGVAR